MRFVYQYPDTHGPDGSMLDAGDIGEMAATVETAGFDGFALTEHPAPSARWLAAGGHQTVDPFVALGYAAARTERIGLMTYLTVVPYRNPLLLAKAAATVDLLSGGRFVLGVGTGYLKGEFRALGRDFDTRNQAFDEALDVMALHWSGDPFDYEGSDFSARGVQARPAPGRSIPIWIGGNSALTRRRVAARAQGWMPMLGSAELLATTRTPGVGGLDGLAGLIAEVKADAGGRADELEFVLAYHDAGLGEAPTVEVERHRETFAAYASAGITRTVLLAPKLEPAAGREWIATIAEVYL
ncbi:MAG: LLM class F420-dependent oxidoreductase [Actinomycetota bacterium]